MYSKTQRCHTVKVSVKHSEKHCLRGSLNLEGGGGAVGGGRWWGWDEAGFLFDFERDEVGAYYLQFNETFTSEIYKCMFCFSGSKTVAMLVIKITLVKFY